MDALDKMIGEKRAEVSELQARVDVLRAELAALEMAAKLRPSSSAAQSRGGYAAPKRSGGGRRPGDISHEWRGILEGVYRLGMAVDYEMIAEIADERGSKLAMSSVRDRVRNLTRTGLMAGDTTQGFVVTEDAVERFGFTKENGGHGSPPEAKAGEATDLSGLLDSNPARSGA